MEAEELVLPGPRYEIPTPARDDENGDDLGQTFQEPLDATMPQAVSFRRELGNALKRKVSAALAQTIVGLVVDFGRRQRRRLNP